MTESSNCLFILKYSPEEEFLKFDIEPLVTLDHPLILYLLAIEAGYYAIFKT